MTETNWKETLIETSKEVGVAGLSFGIGAFAGELLKSSETLAIDRMQKNFTESLQGLRDNKALLPDLDIKIATETAAKAAHEGKLSGAQAHYIGRFLDSPLKISPLPDTKPWVPSSSPELFGELKKLGGEEWAKSLRLNAKYRPNPYLIMGSVGLAIGEIIYHNKDIEKFFSSK